jgi:hypothetical protein
MRFNPEVSGTAGLAGKAVSVGRAKGPAGSHILEARAVLISDAIAEGALAVAARVVRSWRLTLKAAGALRLARQNVLRCWHVAHKACSTRKACSARKRAVRAERGQWRRRQPRPKQVVGEGSF